MSATEQSIQEDGITHVRRDLLFPADFTTITTTTGLFNIGALSYPIIPLVDGQQRKLTLVYNYSKNAVASTLSFGFVIGGSVLAFANVPMGAAAIVNQMLQFDIIITFRAGNTMEVSGVYRRLNTTSVINTQGAMLAAGIWNKTIINNISNIAIVSAGAATHTFILKQALSETL